MFKGVPQKLIDRPVVGWSFVAVFLLFASLLEGLGYSTASVGVVLVVSGVWGHVRWLQGQARVLAQGSGAALFLRMVLAVQELDLVALVFWGVTSGLSFPTIGHYAVLSRGLRWFREGVTLERAWPEFLTHLPPRTLLLLKVALLIWVPLTAIAVASTIGSSATSHAILWLGLAEGLAWVAEKHCEQAKAESLASLRFSQRFLGVLLLTIFVALYWPLVQFSQPELLAPVAAVVSSATLSWVRSVLVARR